MLKDGSLVLLFLLLLFTHTTMHVPTSETVMNMVVTLPRVLATRMTTRTGCVVVVPMVLLVVVVVVVGVVVTSPVDTG